MSADFLPFWVMHWWAKRSGGADCFIAQVFAFLPQQLSSRQAGCIGILSATPLQTNQEYVQASIKVREPASRVWSQTRAIGLQFGADKAPGASAISSTRALVHSIGDALVSTGATPASSALNLLSGS